MHLRDGDVVRDGSDEVSWKARVSERRILQAQVSGEAWRVEYSWSERPIQRE